jgi:hypothetical protein
MSQQACLMLGVTLLTVPTVVYGGLVVLGVLSGGAYGAPGPTGLSPTQQSLYRAMHAHAGVLLILSLVLQIALDHVPFEPGTTWVLRILAPAAAVLVSVGFVCLAHLPALRWVLYAGAASVVIATLATGIGLLRGLA